MVTLQNSFLPPVWTAWFSSSSSSSISENKPEQNKTSEASLTNFQSILFYCFKKEKNKKIVPEPGCIYFLYIICREEKEKVTCVILPFFSLFKEICFCCSDYSKRLNQNVCMLQHANCLWYPPPPSMC